MYTVSGYLAAVSSTAVYMTAVKITAVYMNAVYLALVSALHRTELRGPQYSRQQ